MDYEKLREAITERTKVIIPVDIGGVICSYAELYRALLEKAAFIQTKDNLEITRVRYFGDDFTSSDHLYMIRLLDF